MKFRLLAWDSEFLGLSVAEVDPALSSATELPALLASLKEEGVGLVYFAPEADRVGARMAAHAAGGFLADVKLTYHRTIRESELPAVPGLAGIATASYASPAPNAALRRLAQISNRYSRFRTDPRFAPATCERLYDIWIERSVSGALATSVLTALDEGGREIGLTTLGRKQDEGDIGLVAVDEAYNRRGVGRLLISEALARFRADGLSGVRVVTQQANTGACILYEKCGFVLKKREYFYHFWL